jgi:2-phosphosulfolactate phosphatase
MIKRNLEICLTPAIFSHFENKDAIVVIIDVLRASSAICAAFSNGALAVIPVAEISEAQDYKRRGFLVAAERDGYVLDFADFGNSPFNFTRERVAGKTIVYSTTNGTRIIKLTSSSYGCVIGSFNNFSSLVQWLLNQNHDLILLCAGWKDKINLEDTICAGAMAEKLLESGLYSTICDSAHVATDLWRKASTNPLNYIEKAAQRSRLRDKGLDDCIEYCMTFDVSCSIPVIINGILTDAAGQLKRS